MKKSLKIVIILLFVVLIVMIIVLVGRSIRLVVEDNLLCSADFHKYSDNIIVSYGYGNPYQNRKNDWYLWDAMNDKHDINGGGKTKTNHIDNQEKYKLNNINGKVGIYDSNNNIILEKQDLEYKFNEKNLKIRNIKYNSNNNTIFFILTNNYDYNSINCYCIDTKELTEILHTVSLKQTGGALQNFVLTKGKLYAQNENFELCEYDIISKTLTNLGFKSILYSILNDKIVFINEHNEVCLYDCNNQKIINKIKSDNHIDYLSVDKPGNFVLVHERIFGLTNLTRSNNTLDFTPLQKNQLVIYELSSGKHKVIKTADSNHLVIGGSFVE